MWNAICQTTQTTQTSRPFKNGNQRACRSLRGNDCFVLACLLACLLACVIVRLQSRRTPAIKKGWDGTTIVGLHFSGRSSFFFFVDSDWPITRLAEEAFGAWTVRVDLDDAPKSCVLSLSQTPRTKMGTETKTTAMFVLERGKPFGRVPQQAPTLRHRRHEQSAYAEAPSGTHRQERTVRNAPSGTHRQERTPLSMVLRWDTACVRFERPRARMRTRPHWRVGEGANGNRLDVGQKRRPSPHLQDSVWAR